jgi:RHS repeat-associated protein
VASAVGNPYFFTGRRLDFETGLYYYRARMYSPDMGRFLQTDPIGYGDGIHWYAYCGNNPVVLVDPEGLSVLGGYVSMIAGQGFDRSVDLSVRDYVNEFVIPANIGSITEGAKGWAAWADGAIPFADPFANTYNASEMGWSRAMGAVSRNAALVATGAWAWQAAGGATMQMGVSYSAQSGIHFMYGTTTATGGTTLLNSLPIGGQYVVTQAGTAYYAAHSITLSGIPAFSAGILATEGVTGLTCFEAMLVAAHQSGAAYGLIADGIFIFGEPAITHAVGNRKKGK